MSTRPRWRQGLFVGLGDWRNRGQERRVLAWLSMSPNGDQIEAHRDSDDLILRTAKVEKATRAFAELADRSSPIGTRCGRGFFGWGQSRQTRRDG